MGLSRKAAAKQMGVDGGTLARWERSEREREPTGALLSRVQRFVSGEDTRHSDARRAGRASKSNAGVAGSTRAG